MCSMPNKISKNIGNEIKRVRIERNISQVELAKLTKMTQPAIARIESGNINISVGKLYDICRVLLIDKIKF